MVRSSGPNSSSAGGARYVPAARSIAGYLAYPLGFNNAVVKLVFSDARGYQQPANFGYINGGMYSARLRFAYYY